MKEGRHPQEHRKEKGIMKTRAAHFIVLLCPLLLLSGCAAKMKALPASSEQKSNLTPGMVKESIVQGQTSQTDILRAFGAPNIITRDRGGREVWTYDVQFTATAAQIAEWQMGGGLSGGLAGWGSSLAGLGGGSLNGRGGETTSTSQVSSGTFTLMITFNVQDLVDEYTMMSTKF